MAAGPHARRTTAHAIASLPGHAARTPAALTVVAARAGLAAVAAIAAVHAACATVGLRLVERDRQSICPWQLARKLAAERRRFDHEPGADRLIAQARQQEIDIGCRVLVAPGQQVEHDAGLLITV